MSEMGSSDVYIHHIKIPNLFIVGAPKCGTTSLVNYLAQHPDIYFPAIKEPKHFSAPDKKFPHNGPRDTNVDDQMIISRSDYLHLYESPGDAKIIGDASVDYLYYQNTAERIFDFNPDAQIIIMLRNPVLRAYSAYMHLRRDGRENLDFGEALQREEERRDNNWEFFWRYKEVGLYSSQVKRYINIFGASAVQLYLFEEFIENPNKFLQLIISNLDLSSNYQSQTDVKHNISGIPRSKRIHYLLNKPNIFKSVAKQIIPVKTLEKIRQIIAKENLRKDEIPSELYDYLRSYYKPDILKLSELVGMDFSLWLQ